MSARRSTLATIDGGRRRQQRSRRRRSTASSINICSASCGSRSSGGAYADLRASSIRGCSRSTATPAPAASLETVFNNFTSAVQSLVTSPDSTAARSLVLSNAQVLAQTLNSTTADIQSLRGRRRERPADAVAAANDAMQQIAELNTQLAGKDITNASDAALADQRDNYVDQLVAVDGHPGRHEQPEPGQRVHQFRRPAGRRRRPRNCPSMPQGTVTPTTLWDADPTKSNLGTLTLVSPSGGVDRPDRQQLDPLRQDRRLSRHARQRAGAGAEPARRPGGDDGAGAVGRHDRRRRRDRPARRAAFRRRHRGTAERQSHQSDLHRHADQHPASTSASCGSTIPRRCRSTTARPPIRTTRWSASISPAGLPRW